VSKNSQDQQGVLFIGDNLALDFINTQYGIGSAHRECFVDDASVVEWLKLTKLLPEDFQKAPEGLLKLALELRDNARALVTVVKSSGDANVSLVNEILEFGHAKKELHWDSASRSFNVVTQRRQDDAASMLEPVADALVNLLTRTNLELVRQCDAHDCTLMFLDMTKSHRRRWCSMSLCGNRMKVAAFRSRTNA